MPGLFTGKELISRLAEQGPELNDVEGMQQCANELAEADPAFNLMLLAQYGQEFVTGLFYGLTTGLYLIKEMQRAKPLGE